MASVDLNDQEWGQLMFVLANAEGKGITWAMVNPLLMKIGAQLQAQTIGGAPRQATVEQTKGIKLDGNGQEVRHE
jgi:hypothetical protein